MSDLFDDKMDLADALGGIAAEAGRNAAVKPIGSIKDGTRRYTGFADAQGYIEALARGVKRATADQYKRTLVTQYRMTQAAVDALPLELLRGGLVTRQYSLAQYLDTITKPVPRRLTARATKNAYRSARRAGKSIPWSQAKALAIRWNQLHGRCL